MLFLIILIILIRFIGISQEKADSVVGIAIDNRIIGTGFVIDEGIMTAWHVAKSFDTLYAFYSNGKKSQLELIRYNEKKDYAILKACTQIESHKLVISKRELRPLENVYSLGHPLGIPFVYYRGYVQLVSEDIYLLSFDIAGGMSGAPLIGEDSMVHGIIVGIQFDGVSLANKL